MDELAPTVIMEGEVTVAPAAREFLITTDELVGNGKEGENLDEATGSVPIDENLFADEDDLDDLEDDLEDLDVND